MEYYETIKGKLLKANVYKLLKSTFLRAFNKIANEDKTVIFNLNIYIDFCLQKGFKAKSKKEIDSELNKISQIFFHIKEKDIFEIYYKKLLSRRLINQWSLCDDFELLMIEKLKKECGSYYTKKIESMLKDFRLSLELNSDFHQ